MEPAVQEPLLTFPKRPQPSPRFSATPIKLKSNHFTISIASRDLPICLYNMKIVDCETENEIPADARALKTGILKSAKRPLKELFGVNCWASGLVLWSNKDQEGPRTIKTTEKGRNYAIVLTKVREITLSPDVFQDNETAAKVRQYLNVIIKRYFKLKDFQEWNLNSKFYDWKNKEDVEEFPLAICKGYKTSCEVYQSFVPKVLVDCVSRIVHTTSVLDYLKHLKGKKKTDQEIREILRGRSVIASYGNFKMWRIDDIDFSANEESMFEIKEGRRKISYIEYYKNQYNIEIKHVQPGLLIHINRKTGNKIVLLPELVQMTGLDDDQRADQRLMEQVAKSTRLQPDRRMKKIESEVDKLAGFYENDYGISLYKKSIVDGLVLTVPELKLGDKSLTPKEGNFNLRDPIFKPKNLTNWLLVYPEVCREEANKFSETLIKCSKAYAIQVLEPKKFEITSKKVEDLKQAIRNKMQENTSIVVCVYPPEAKKYWYKGLKEVCYKEKGVPCQAVVTSSLKEDKPMMSVCSKILLQMNAKIGGELWITQIPEGLPEKTMIIGADVYHKTKVGEELKSCIGFCATLNPHFSKFFSKVHFQNRVGEEIMVNIGKLVKEAVLKYFTFNDKKFLPECIIFFRDGLADNQLKLALQIETKGILEQLKTINPDYNPKFAEIVVTKRIDDRIFSIEESQRSGVRSRGSRSNRPGRDFSEDEVFNPPPGTVVADTIVSNNFDYLIASQNVEQGTCTPTRYNVIYDTTGLSQDVFWELTYWQCYNYFNWSGSVRVPAPVQYAHKMAYLVGQTVQGDVNSKLVESLYYL